MIEILATSDFRAPECGDGAPAAVLIRVDVNHFIIGEELHSTTELVAIGDLTARLRELKDARQERHQTVLDVADGVPYDRLVGVLDAIQGVHMFPTVLVTPSGSQFTESNWSRPQYRDRLLPPPFAAPR